jgi:surface antigen
MSLRRVALIAFATAALATDLVAVGAQAAPFPQGLAQLASTATKAAPCASGNAAMGAAVGAGASAIAKKTGVKNAEVVGVVIGALLTDKIACLLNPGEQTAAATATQTAVTQGVGSNVKWTSTSRPNVTGTSAVLSEAKRTDGSLCRAVRDVVIVSGEETTVTKTLCRAPGTAGFALAAAS